VDRAEAWLLQTAGSPLTFVVVVAVLAVGVVVVFLPSESLVVAVAALLLARPDRDLRLPALVVASAVGLAAGDLLLYALARRLRRTRHPEGRSSLVDRFRGRLDARAATLRSRFRAHPLTTMIFARLVPVGRASSDVIAAELEVPVRRFAVYSLAGGLVYGVWCVAIAALAYPLVQRHPLESMVGVIVLAVLLSSAVGRLDAWLERRRSARRSTRTTRLPSGG
jgi:membrane-associated protein